MPSGGEYDDPEAAYRRGYQQGANDAVEALASGKLKQPQYVIMRDWVGRTLYDWRYRDQPTNRNVFPPRPPISN